MRYRLSRFSFVFSASDPTPSCASVTFRNSRMNDSRSFFPTAVTGHCCVGLPTASFLFLRPHFLLGWPGWFPTCACPTRGVCDRALREHRGLPGQPSSSPSFSAPYGVANVVRNCARPIDRCVANNLKRPSSPRPIHHHRHANEAHHRPDDIESIRLHVVDEPPPEYG